MGIGPDAASSSEEAVVRFFCPESPYWLRARDRGTRLRAAVARGEQVSAEDSAWQRKAEKPGLGQLFLADQRRRTIVAIFVPVTGLMAFTILGAWQPLYLHNELGWTTSEYSLYSIWSGLAGTSVITCLAGSPTIAAGSARCSRAICCVSSPSFRGH